MASDVSDNWREVLDEVQALDAIYGEDFRLHGLTSASSPGGGGLVTREHGMDELLELEEPEAGKPWTLACSIDLHLDLPPPGLPPVVRVAGAGDQGAGPSTSGAGEDGTSEEEGPPASSLPAPIQYLPPLVLHLALHEAYPSALPPRLAVEATWLSHAAATDLATRLAALWHIELQGQPAAYAWAEWLRGNALGEEAGGVLAVSADSEAEAQPLLGVLLRHDAACKLRAWLAESHTCGICLEELPGASFRRLGCGHAFCGPCLTEQAVLAVREGALGTLRCPEPGCGSALDPGTLRALLPQPAYERWEALTLDRALAAMPDASACPRCATPCLEDEDGCARCERCFFVFCALCLDGWHPGTACVTPATRLAMLRARAEGGGAQARAALRRAEQEAASEALLAREAVRCPRCGVAVAREAGCNKMVCAACSGLFCYRCGRGIRGYDHFRDGGCVLFDEAEILRWEDAWEEQVAAHRAGGLDGGGGGAAADGPHRNLGAGPGHRPRRARGAPLGVAPCPQCGQFIQKQGGNNHMLCWSCTSHFCYLCRALLLRRGEGASHFGPSGCRQHSGD